MSPEQIQTGEQAEHAGEARAFFQPLSVRGLTLANRFVMAPMTREFSPGGAPGADVAAYYQRRALGEAGLIITEGCGVDHPLAVDKPGIPVMSGPQSQAAWRAVVEGVHKAGGRIALQLWHQGPVWAPSEEPERMSLAIRPSGIWGPREGTRTLDADYVARALSPTRPATDSEIAEVIEAFARSAAAAAAVGFDAIAIHAAHGYLIDAFLWGETNRRQDDWGGDVGRRARLAAEIVRAIRRAVGEQLPIIFRFSQWKLQDYKARLADAPEALEALLTPIADAGVDVFDGSQRYFDTPIYPGSPLNLAGWAKKLTGRLSMTVGGIGLGAGISGNAAEAGAATAADLTRLATRFAHGEFDLVGVGRALLNDAQWVRRIRAGEPTLSFDPENLKRLS